MMDRRLSKQEILYLLDHLEPLYIGVSLKDYLSAGEGYSGEGRPEAAGFLIPLSDKGLEFSDVLTLEGIPVLFPCSNQARWYSQEGQQVFFHHDILKSAFFLLSGYQEYHLPDRDKHGRFPWKASVQHRLGITQKPVVNYYFEIILEAFEKFCRLNQLDFKKTERTAPLLFLSHDVDRIRKYTLKNLAISTLQLMGLKEGSAGKGRQGKIVADYFKGILLFRKNPYWTFQEMCDMEEELHISSTWFFLEKTKQDNSSYPFDQARIRTLISYLSKRGHEIGIHGTLESSSDQEAMDGGIRRLNAACKSPVSGIRQHYLKYHLPQTTGIQEAAGLEYDASLGFAEQPGFRNSYAYPFRLFNFEKQKTYELWQLPLNVMEAGLIEYMELPVEAFPATLAPLLAEVSRFKGLFSLLWHNCRLDEEANPGIKGMYRQVLEGMVESGFVSVTGREAVNEFKSAGASGKNS